ncbi:hypothetical protein C8F04DRAFT_1253461 [Mycena alexandri]|uniref:3-oxoacyl-[acyl-carrier-protein] reductase n=1 Tax=Mycena alexandri TaxID=1745969 RepID=A0AAD6XAK5_9AGAR|nr:hypothetical protein C8F04DRAFT_1253461 [Mycena alexandri]
MHATVRQMRTTLELKQMVFKGVALVTGAARGIGKAISLRLAHDGFKVAINDISTKTKMLDSVVEEMKAKGQVSSAHVADVTVEDEVRGIIKGVVDTHGRLDVMVANAGVASYTPLLQLGLDEWERIMKINAQGVFLCYKHAAVEFGPHGITVNAYAPGAIDTEMLSATMTDDTPHEVLIDEESKFITGQSISVNGGVYFD